jgi:hydroxyacylglutathione hydrolase
MLRVTALRAFTDNYIWLIHSPHAAHRVLAVDPGDAAPVQRALSAARLELAGILLTHHHLDHVGGVTQLAQSHAPRVSAHYAEPLKIAAHDAEPLKIFGPASERVPGQPMQLREGDRVELPDLDLAFDVLDVPGHTAGHIAYVGHGALFCGDTLFSAGCGRLFEGTAEQMQASLQKLTALPEDTLVYCAHEYTVNNLKFALAVEPHNAAARQYLEECLSRRARDEATVPSTIGRERNVNPFLRCDQETVKQAAAAHAGRRLNSLEVFAVVRKWKDGFKS